MKSIFAAAALMTAVAAAPLASAEAAVIYNYAGVSQPGSVTPVPLDIRLELTSAGSSFNLNGGPNPGPNPVLTGNTNRFISLMIGTDRISTSFLQGELRLGLTFDSAGSVTSTSLFYRGVSYDADLSGTSAVASGNVSSDAGNCSISERNCSVSGSWTATNVPVAVPEPMSLAIFGAGLAGLAMVRRRKA